MEKTITRNQEVLAAMLTENTGRHMLDSGGAYGRNWERAQGKTVEDFIAEPDMLVQKYGVYINIFHYLDANIEYDEELDNEFQEWMNEDERKDESYFACVYEWCEKEDREEYIMGGLTYNYDNFLSQDFQADTFNRDGESYICLSIHGGCDIRGGYTRPRIFKVDSYDSMFMADIDSYTMHCGESTGRKGEPITLDVRCGEVYHVETDQSIGGYYTKSDDEPLLNWLDLWDNGENGETPEWDEENQRYNAPDGDGWLEFYGNFYY